MDCWYERAGVVVVTSRSEGIPLVLMEAMACGKIVLAPEITGIPELVIPGRTGFLYRPGSNDDFVSKLRLIHSLLHENASSEQKWLRNFVGEAARAQVIEKFNQKTNLESFADYFLRRIELESAGHSHEDFVLQQVQPSI
jgi:glycosyltransferase involved in cell wall biosynthesis